MGHEALAHLCICHWARFRLLRLHHPHDSWWLQDVQKKATNVPICEAKKVRDWGQGAVDKGERMGALEANRAHSTRPLQQLVIGKSRCKRMVG